MFYNTTTKNNVTIIAVAGNNPLFEKKCVHGSTYNALKTIRVFWYANAGQNI